LTITEVALHLATSLHGFALIFDINGLGYILGVFSQAHLVTLELADVRRKNNTDRA
jgi:hypothetical protein